jgi:hypothetical protein
MTPLGDVVFEGLEGCLPSDAFDKKEFVAIRAGMGSLGQVWALVGLQVFPGFEDIGESWEGYRASEYLTVTDSR